MILVCSSRLVLAIVPHLLNIYIFGPYTIVTIVGLEGNSGQSQKTTIKTLMTFVLCQTGMM